MDLLAPLDYPRQAVWNAARTAGKAISGEATWEDALRAAPGLLGAGLAGGLMATGVGAPAGILAGSLLAGAGQGLGRATADETFKAPEVSDVTGTEDFLPNLLVSALTDPLTYAGASLGGAGGRSLFGKVGPRYAGGMEKLAEATQAGGRAAEMAEAMKQSPVASKLLGEIPAGSTLFADSNNALAFRTPQKDVLRIAAGEGAAPASRAAIPEMLQPTRNVPIGNYRVERVPFAERVGDRELYREAYQPLAERIRGQGFHPSDLTPPNIGEFAGRPVLIDPGAVAPRPGGPDLPRAADALGSTPWQYLFPGLGLGGASAVGIRGALTPG